MSAQNWSSPSSACVPPVLSGAGVAVGAASEYRHADEGWGLPISQPYPGDPELSWHLIDSLVTDEFDVTM